jgi:dipeptidyl aminopeptidase/acylaminoacyl peptidase
VKFGTSKTIKVATRDGLLIESYLAMPPSPEKAPPLIVMPHGGPIGIRDDRHFDHSVQFLVSLGYAVLQVNFRGSEGFGKSFREAGKGSLGTAIEDDVDTVLTEVLKTQPVDKNNMCIMGMSYGGYSALVSSMRWPGRFKCAISFSGPTDRILTFSASDSVRSEPTRKWMEKYFGNPKTELAKMKSEQPLYSYKNLNTPLLLIHGTVDYRVDYEHVVRLQRMLTLANNPPAVLTLKSEGHGFTNLSSKKVTWGAIAGFLEQHLPRPPKQAKPTEVPAATGIAPAK